MIFRVSFNKIILCQEYLVSSNAWMFNFWCFKCEYYFKYDRAKSVGRLEEDWKRLEEMAVHKVASLDISNDGKEIIISQMP